MAKEYYSKFSEHLLYDIKMRRIQSTDVYKTKDCISTEYHCVFAKALSRMYDLLKTVSLDHELKFYINLDMLTYIPFEKLGDEYLSKKLEKENSDLTEFKYNAIMKLLRASKIESDDELRGNIKCFLDNYYNDTIQINIIGLAIISLRLFHRYSTNMIFEGRYASMRMFKEIGVILDQIVENVNENDLKEININDYMPDAIYEGKQLSEEMIQYIELCLKKEAMD